MEQVFAVRRRDFFAGRWPHGFVGLEPPEASRLLAQLQRRGFFVDRDAAEKDPALKQLIPYCILERDGELFCVQRLKEQSEGRLHGLRSIGIGGHVNPQDHAPRGVLDAGLRRELTEELVIPELGQSWPQFLGLLNDDTTDVGSVHAGLVYRLRLDPNTEIRIRETEKMRGGFRTASDLLRESRESLETRPSTRVVEMVSLWQHSDFESWSSIMLEAGPWARPPRHSGTSSGVASKEDAKDG